MAFASIAAGAATRDLDRHVADRVRWRQIPAERCDHRHDGIEMSTAHRPEHGDQRRQRGNGRAGVGEQRNRFVPSRQPLRHDAGTDDCRRKQRRAKTLGQQSLLKAGSVHFVGRAGLADGVAGALAA